MLYNGRNNGSIFLSVRDAADRLGVTDVNVARNAFDDLQRAGFIIMTQTSSFDLKYSVNNRARSWRLTYKEAQDTETGKFRKVTNEYLNYEPEAGTKDRKRMDSGNKVLKKYRNVQSQNKSQC